MKTIEGVQSLRNKGYNIKFFKRKDGGIIVTKVNNISFRGAKGNTYIRNILNKPLEEARLSQLRKLSEEREKYYKKTKARIKKPTLDADLLKAFRKVQRKYNKEVNRPTGDKLTLSKFRYQVETEGREKALEYLSEKERYRSGIMYTKGVQYLIERIELLKSHLNVLNRLEEAKRCDELIEWIKENKDRLAISKSIEDLFRTIYLIEKGVIELDDSTINYFKSTLSH